MSYDKLQKNLVELREEILSLSMSINSESQDLDIFLNKIRDENPIIYEYLVLVVSDIKTDIRNNKNKMIRILDKSLLIKGDTLNILKQNKPSSSWRQKIWNAITWSNIIKTIGLATTILIIIFIMFEIDPDVMKNIFKGLGSFITNIIKETK